MKLKNKNKYKIDELFNKAKWEYKLQREERLFLETLLNQLNVCTWQKDAQENYYLAILSLGLSSVPQERTIKLVEKFLDKSKFCDTITAASLKVLCYPSYWDLSERYCDVICAYLNSDDEMYIDSHQTSIQCLGFYGNKTKDKNAIRMILNKYEDLVNKGIDECDEIEYECYYNALLSVVWGSDYIIKKNKLFSRTHKDNEIIKEIQDILYGNGV